MSEKKRPWGRLTFKNSDGERFEVGTLWPGYNDGQLGLSPAREASTREHNGKTYRTMPLADAVQVWLAEGGFFDAYKSRAPAAQRLTTSQPRASEHTDDEIPF